MQMLMYFHFYYANISKVNLLLLVLILLSSGCVLYKTTPDSTEFKALSTGRVIHSLTSSAIAIEEYRQETQSAGAIFEAVQSALDTSDPTKLPQVFNNQSLK